MRLGFGAVSRLQADYLSTVQRRPARRWTGGAFTLFMLAAMLVTITVRQGHEVFPGPTLLLFTVLAWLPLLIRIHSPLAALIGTVVAESLHLVVVPIIVPDLNTPIAIAAYQPVPLATMAAAWTLASRTPRTVGWIGGVVAAVSLLTVSVLAGPRILVATDLVMFNLVLIATATGVFVASRRDRAVRLLREGAEETQRQVVAERLRIARDLHDVLAHHLTLVNAQAGVANYLLQTDPQAAAQALQGMSQHTRDALDELRATVGLLRQDGDAAGSPDGSLEPVPGLARLEHLVDGFRAAGATVAVETLGEPTSLAPSADLAAYRVVQEALTNSLKHAPGAVTHLTLEWSSAQLSLTIENGPATTEARPTAGSGSGKGLIGMRERVHACGGEWHAGRLPSGGYRVDATIPVQQDQVAHTANSRMEGSAT